MRFEHSGKVTLARRMLKKRILSCSLPFDSADEALFLFRERYLRERLDWLAKQPDEVVLALYAKLERI